MNTRPLNINSKLNGATMHDIAEKLDISVATVSRALRRVPGIKAETRSRVMQVAAQLGYRLSKTYRSDPLDSDQLRQVGVFIETPQDNVSTPYLTGMSEASIALNASLIVHYVKPENCHKILEPEFQPRAMRSGLLSGIVLVFRWPNAVVKALSRCLPVVSIVHTYPGVEIDLVGLDNYSGIDLIVQHLHNLGHRKIGFLGRCGDLYWSAVRFGAYVSALTRLGLEYRPEWVIDVDIKTLTDMGASYDRYLPKAELLMREGVRAWVCASEPTGWQLHAYLTARGFRVPEDVSITGFHQPDVLKPSDLQLTSVTASYEAIGAAALKRLLYRVQTPAETNRTILFPCELHLGESTAPPP